MSVDDEDEQITISVDVRHYIQQFEDIHFLIGRSYVKCLFT